MRELLEVVEAWLDRLIPECQPPASLDEWQYIFEVDLKTAKSALSPADSKELCEFVKLAIEDRIDGSEIVGEPAATIDPPTENSK